MWGKIAAKHPGLNNQFIHQTPSKLRSAVWKQDDLAHNSNNPTESSWRQTPCRRSKCSVPVSRITAQNVCSRARKGQDLMKLACFTTFSKESPKRAWHALASLTPTTVKNRARPARHRRLDPRESAGGVSVEASAHRRPGRPREKDQSRVSRSMKTVLTSGTPQKRPGVP